jgi:hypothetical protein
MRLAIHGEHVHTAYTHYSQVKVQCTPSPRHAGSRNHHPRYPARAFMTRVRDGTRRLPAMLDHHLQYLPMARDTVDGCRQSTNGTGEGSLIGHTIYPSWVQVRGSCCTTALKDVRRSRRRIRDIWSLFRESSRLIPVVQLAKASMRRSGDGGRIRESMQSALVEQWTHLQRPKQGSLCFLLCFRANNRSPALGLHSQRNRTGREDDPRQNRVLSWPLVIS